MGWLANTCVYDYAGDRTNCTSYGEWWPLTDAHRVISAGCDLANATGGTWAGPTIDSCGAGRSGTLVNVPYGKYFYQPNTTNPSLFSALIAIGLGDPPEGMIALGSGGLTLSFVPIYPFQVDLQVPVSTACESIVLPTKNCQATPTIQENDGTTILTWNWSTNANLDDIYSGDVWNASFSVVATGPPFGTLEPVDACLTSACKLNGSGTVDGLYSSVSYEPAYASLPAPPPETISLPLVMILVEAPPGQGPVSTVPTAPPPLGPGLPAPTPVTFPLPIPVPVVGAGAVVIGTVSIQAVAAGVLSAGFARAALQRRAIRLGQPVGNLVRPKRSAFEDEPPRNRETGPLN